LEETDRRLLQVASVTGRIFALETLDGVVRAMNGKVDIRERLKMMEELGLIEVTDPDTRDYRFIHLTTQEVVYESLSYGLRRDVHCQIGSFIERRHEERLGEQVDLLAYHYLQGQAWPKALEFNLLSGQHAQAEFANQIAITSYENALVAAMKLSEEQDTSQEMEVAYESLGEVMTLVGRYEEALDHYESVRHLVEDRTTSKERLLQLADLSRKTADVYERRSDYEVAFEWLDGGLSYLENQATSIEMVRIYLLGTGIYRRQGKNDEAIVWCEKSLSLFIFVVGI
jgi:predicted ATPase